MTWQVKVDVTCVGQPHVSASFSRSPITLGADADNDVVLKAPHISRRHLDVLVSRGGLVLRDRSRNGCFVDGRRVAPETALGQRCVVGVPPFEIELRFEDEDAVWQTAYRSVANLVPPVADLDPTHVTESRPTPTVALPTLRRDDAPVTQLTPHGPGNDRATLEVVEGSEMLLGRVFELLPDRRMVVGRGAEAAVVLSDRTVSRRHAEMTLGPDGLDVRDLASANGMWRNDERVDRALLVDGERIAFGQVTLVLHRPQSDAACAPPRRLRVSAHTVEGHDDRLLLVVRGAAVDSERDALTKAFAVVDDPRIAGLVLDLSAAEPLGGTARAIIADTAEALDRRGGVLVIAGAAPAAAEALARGPSGALLRAHSAPSRANGCALLECLL